MKPFLNRLARFKVISWLFGASALFVISGTLWAYAALRGVRGPLILHYSSASGIGEIGGLWGLLKMGVAGLLVVIVNFFLALELEERDSFFGRFVAATTVLLSVLIFIGFAAIISVN